MNEGAKLFEKRTKKKRSRQLTNHGGERNEKRRDKGGNETQAAHTNYCNKQIYIKAGIITSTAWLITKAQKRNAYLEPF